MNTTSFPVFLLVLIELRKWTLSQSLIQIRRMPSLDYSVQACRNWRRSRKLVWIQHFPSLRGKCHTIWQEWTLWNEKKKKELILIGFREAFRPSNLLCLNLVALLACFGLSFSRGPSREKAGGRQTGEKKRKREKKKTKEEKRRGPLLLSTRPRSSPLKLLGSCSLHKMINTIVWKSAKARENIGLHSVHYMIVLVPRPCAVDQ